LIFAILRSLPNDGTFDQDASFRRCIDKSAKYGCSYGYDLSAATDRLPVSIQVPIVRAIFHMLGTDNPALAARYWADILIERGYRCSGDSGDRKNPDP